MRSDSTRLLLLKFLGRPHKFIRDSIES